MFPGRKTCAPPPIATPADHHDFRPVAPNCSDLLRTGSKRLPAIDTDRPLSVLVDQKHMLLLLSVQPCRCTVFRAASAAIQCRRCASWLEAPVLDYILDACNGQSRFPVSALITRDIGRRQAVVIPVSPAYSSLLPLPVPVPLRVPPSPQPRFALIVCARMASATCALHCRISGEYQQTRSLRTLANAGARVAMLH
jgi:hypothetical protein